MTAADEYQRVLAGHELDPMPPRRMSGRLWLWRCICGADIESLKDHGAHVAQALAADPGVRAAVEQEAHAEALREVLTKVNAIDYSPELEHGDNGEWMWDEVRSLLLNEIDTLSRQEPSDGE